MVRGEMEMKLLNKRAKDKEIDWKEISRDLRADIIGKPFAYRRITYYK